MRQAVLLALVFLLPVAAGGAVHSHQWVATSVTTPEEAAQLANATGYPLPGLPENRFADWQQREELASAGNLTGAYRVLRFAHITDLQLIDDDAPPPMRVDHGDDAFDGAEISDGAQRPHEELADEILHSLVDVLNHHHDLDRFAYAIHTGDNIDNALENELMRYFDILHGTHTTAGPLTGLECQPDGQSESVDDLANDVTTACTSLPEHLVDDLRGLAPSMPWFSMNGNHDTLIQGNVNPNPEFQQYANAAGRHWFEGNQYVQMHFENLDICAGGSPNDFEGHGFGFADEERRCDSNPSNDAYYAFTYGGIRMIILDTVNDEVYETNNQTSPLPGDDQTGHRFASGLSEGAIDAEQFAWLQAELDAAANQPVIIYAHHTISAFYSKRFDPACGPPGCLNDVLGDAGFIGREQMNAELENRTNILGFVGGHTHKHRVSAMNNYWNIETSGMLDLPQESRIIELWYTNDGKGFWALDPIGHTFAPAQELAATDSQHDVDDATGTELDRRVILWFDSAPGVELPAKGHQPPVSAAEQPPVEAPILRVNLIDNHGEYVAGNVSLQVEVSAQGNAVMGLHVSLLTGDETLQFHDESNGLYTAIWDAEAGIHNVTIIAEDPLGIYQSGFLEVTINVGKAEESTPSISVAVVLLALVALAFVRRR